MSHNANAQQVSLYNEEGEAIAYIDYGEEASIFLFDGTPVAFLEKDGDEIHIWGFNRSFLGWYEDGKLYDEEGEIVGGREDAIAGSVDAEPWKGMQSITPIRPITSIITPRQPTFRNTWSDTPLIEFLYFGKK